MRTGSITRTCAPSVAALLSSVTTRWPRTSSRRPSSRCRGPSGAFEASPRFARSSWALAVNQRPRHHVRAAARPSCGGVSPCLGHGDATTRATASSPETEAARKQLANALLRGLDRLSLEHRAVVVLCDVEERTSAEAAVIVDAPEATVRTRLFHARRKLRAFLEGEGFR